MTTSATKRQSSRLRREAVDGGDRYVDLQIDWRDEATNELMLRVGGRWDRSEKRFTGEKAKTSLVFRFTAAQIEPARWLSRWLKAYSKGERLMDPPAKEGESERDIYSVLMGGGRRGGKTDLLWKFMVTFGVMVPKSRVWIVSPAQPETEELELAIDDGMPKEFFFYKLGAPWFYYKMINGSRVWLRSGHVPSKLKRGRCDVVGLNEAQNMPQKTYVHVRAPIADTGGLVLMAANPPDTEEGMWLLDYQEKAVAKRMAGRFFFVDPEKNPHVDRKVLASMKEEIDLRTYQIEIQGMFLPRIDVTFYSFSDDNVREKPELPSSNITREYLAEKFGGEGRFTKLVGMDFQRRPHVVAVVFDVFRNPIFGGEPLLWVTDEVLVDQGNEIDLARALERKGYSGQTCAVVADASGDWQDVDHTKGKTSFDELRKVGWAWLFKPDPDAERNPDIMERISVGNSRMRSCIFNEKSEIIGQHSHLFVDPSCFYVTRCCKRWNTKNGMPNRKSDFAHVGDALTYPLYRLYPRRLNTKGTTYEYESLYAGQRRSEMEGY